MFINFDPPGSMGTRAASINEAGFITGSYVVAGDATPAGPPTRGFLRAPDGTFTTFDAPSGSRTIAPTAINRGGVIAGSYEDDGTAARHGFVRAVNGDITTFDPPDSQYTTPTGINDASVIVGQYLHAVAGVNVYSGFVRDPDGTITTLAAAGFTSIESTSINDAGVTTGTCNDAAGVYGFVRASDGTFTTFEVPGVNSGYAVDFEINAGGVVVGWYMGTGGSSHGFVRAVNGDIATFDPPPGFSNIEPKSINDAGVVTGYYFGAGNVFHGFLRASDGAFSALDDPDAGNDDIQGTTPVSINESGMVTGAFIDSNNVYHGFLTDGVGFQPPKVLTPPRTRFAVASPR